MPCNTEGKCEWRIIHRFRLFCQADWLAVLAARQVRYNDDNVIIPKLIYRRIILKLSTFPIRKLYENYKHIFIFLEHYSVIKRIGHKIGQPRLVEAKKDLLAKDLPQKSWNFLREIRDRNNISSEENTMKKLRFFYNGKSVKQFFKYLTKDQWTRIGETETDTRICKVFQKCTQNYAIFFVRPVRM